jgi:UDP-N-acetylglucosamine transferase subunit ALG13
MILVSVGTNEQPFDRLVAAAGELAGPEPVIIQHGASQLRPPRADCRDFMPFEQIEQLVGISRAFVCHAGVGSIGVALRLGRRPIVMARRVHLGEAVDDHQVPFALRLARAGKVPNPLSAHKAKDNDQVKQLWKLLEAEDKARPDSRPLNVQEQ